MKKYTYTYRMYFLLFCIVSKGYMYGQEKYEKEYRIKEKEVPISAIQFVNALKFNKKIKWYAEEGLRTKSIEAKTKFNKRRYSVEFDTIGNLQDIEVQIPYKKIPKATREAITAQLKNDFTDFKLIKTQVQYTGDKDTLVKFHLNPFDKKGIVTKYEIVLRGKNDCTYSGYEYRFSEKGHIEHSAIIIFRNTDNLEY